jgi:hypothetical protein
MKSRARLCNCSGSALLTLCVIVAAGAAAGCTGKPFLSNGDANSAEVGYGGNDPAVATAVAKEHCARFERVPRFLNAQENVAYFACENP